GRITQRRGVAAGAGGPPGRCPGRPPARLPRGDHPAESRAASLRGGCRPDGPLGRRGPYALDPGAGTPQQGIGGPGMIAGGPRPPLRVNPAGPPDGADEAELAQVLDAYLAEFEAGRPVDPEAWVGRHPAIADRLRACLKGLHLIEAAAETLALAPEPAQGG